MERLLALGTAVLTGINSIAETPTLSRRGGLKYRRCTTLTTRRLRLATPFAWQKYVLIALTFTCSSVLHRHQFGGGFLLGWGSVAFGGTGYEKYCARNSVVASATLITFLLKPTT